MCYTLEGPGPGPEPKICLEIGLHINAYLAKFPGSVAVRLVRARVRQVVNGIRERVCHAGPNITTRVGGKGVCRETSKERHLYVARRIALYGGLQRQFLVRARNASGRSHF